MEILDLESQRSSSGLARKCMILPISKYVDVRLCKYIVIGKKMSLQFSQSLKFAHAEAHRACFYDHIVVNLKSRHGKC